MSVSTLVSGVERFFRERARQAGLSLETHLADQEIELWADETKLKQVLLNLVSNAIKFTPSGGRVSVSAVSRPDERLELIVADSGIGIAEGDLDRIFDPFVQVDSSLSRRHAGTGVTVLLPGNRVQAFESIRAAV